MNAKYVTSKREQTEDEWREKLLRAQRRYRSARREATNGDQTSVTELNEALAEYTKVLDAFSRLVLDDEYPAEIGSMVA